MGIYSEILILTNMQTKTRPFKIKPEINPDTMQVTLFKNHLITSFYNRLMVGKLQVKNVEYMAFKLNIKGMCADYIKKGYSVIFEHEGKKSVVVHGGTVADANLKLLLAFKNFYIGGGYTDLDIAVNDFVKKGK